VIRTDLDEVSAIAEQERLRSLVEPTGDLPTDLGYGLAHPRRFGLACHLGVVTGIAAFGVAKTAFIGTGEAPGLARGDTSDLLDGEEVIGRVLRTQHGVKPVFVSVGHKIDLARATSMTLELTPSYRLPQTTRLADQMSRRALAAGSSL